MTARLAILGLLLALLGVGVGYALGSNRPAANPIDATPARADNPQSHRPSGEVAHTQGTAGGPLAPLAETDRRTEHERSPETSATPPKGSPDIPERWQPAPDFVHSRIEASPEFLRLPSDLREEVLTHATSAVVGELAQLDAAVPELPDGIRRALVERSAEWSVLRVEPMVHARKALDRSGKDIDAYTALSETLRMNDDFDQNRGKQLRLDFARAHLTAAQLHRWETAILAQRAASQASLERSADHLRGKPVYRDR